MTKKCKLKICDYPLLRLWRHLWMTPLVKLSFGLSTSPNGIIFFNIFINKSIWVRCEERRASSPNKCKFSNNQQFRRSSSHYLFILLNAKILLFIHYKNVKFLVLLKRTLCILKEMVWISMCVCVFYLPNGAKVERIFKTKMMHPLKVVKKDSK